MKLIKTKQTEIIVEVQMGLRELAIIRGILGKTTFGTMIQSAKDAGITTDNDEISKIYDGLDWIYGEVAYGK